MRARLALVYLSSSVEAWHRYTRVSMPELETHEELAIFVLATAPLEWLDS